MGERRESTSQPLRKCWAKTGPLLIEFATSRYCNLSCDHCVSNPRPRQRRLGPEFNIASVGAKREAYPQSNSTPRLQPFGRLRNIAIRIGNVLPGHGVRDQVDALRRFHPIPATPRHIKIRDEGSGTAVTAKVPVPEALVRFNMPALVL